MPDVLRSVFSNSRNKPTRPHGTRVPDAEWKAPGKPEKEPRQPHVKHKDQGPPLLPGPHTAVHLLVASPQGSSNFLLREEQRSMTTLGFLERQVSVTVSKKGRKENKARLRRAPTQSSGIRISLRCARRSQEKTGRYLQTSGCAYMLLVLPEDQLKQGHGEEQCQLRKFRTGQFLEKEAGLEVASA